MLEGVGEEYLVAAGGKGEELRGGAGGGCFPFFLQPRGAYDPEVPVAPHYYRDLLPMRGLGKFSHANSPAGKTYLGIDSFISDQLCCQLSCLQAQTPFPISYEMVLAKSETPGSYPMANASLIPSP